MLIIVRGGGFASSLACSVAEESEEDMGGVNWFQTFWCQGEVYIEGRWGGGEVGRWGGGIGDGEDSNISASNFKTARHKLCSPLLWV